MGCNHRNKYFQKYYKLISLASLLVIIFACSTTKKVPDGDFLLVKNNFKFLDKKAPFDDELPDYVQQKPNKKKLLFLPIGLMLYNAANPKYDTLLNDYMTYPKEMRNGKLRDSLFIKYNMKDQLGKSLLVDRILHNYGAPPVIFDQNKAEKSTESIKNRLIYRGYWDAKVAFSKTTDSTTKKATSTYFVSHNAPTYIKEYFYNIPDPGIKSIYEQKINETFIKNKSILDQTLLEKEVTRINEMMKENGYYNFNLANNQVGFVADSLKDKKQIPLVLEIHKDSLDTRYKKATIGNIDVAIVENAKDFPAKTVKDSLRKIRFHKMDNAYKSNALWRAIIVEPKTVYDQNQLDLTKRNILAMNNFSIIKARDSLRRGGLSSPNDSIIDVLYILKPLDQYDVKLSTDINYSQLLNFGISPTLDLTTRNVFGGAENLSTSLSTVIGSIRNPKNLDKRIIAYEIAAQASLNFPRLLLPFTYYKLIPKRYSPTTAINLGTSIQNNIGLGRINFNTGLNYTATVNDKISHRLTLFNTLFSLTQNKEKYYDFFVSDDVIREGVFQDYFLYNPQAALDFQNGLVTKDGISEQIINDAGYVNTLSDLRADNLTSFLGTLVNKDRQTQDVLISSLIYNYIYNEIGKKDYPNAFYFNGKVEFAGNIPSLFNQKNNVTGITTSPQKTLFGIPYAQFIKMDLDVRKYFKFATNHTLVFRQFIGLGLPYGNSSTMPFVRSYFNGGSNDIRAWTAFGGLGPGASTIDDRVRTYLMGNIKLTTNVEYRIPFNDMYEGAVFTDFGNIWNTKDNGFDDQFKFNKFLSEMAIGSGLGVRVNIAYITLRVDLAYQLYDPNRPTDQRWRFKEFNPLKPTLNFGFGYPF